MCPVVSQTRLSASFSFSTSPDGALDTRCDARRSEKRLQGTEGGPQTFRIQSRFFGYLFIYFFLPEAEKGEFGAAKGGLRSKASKFLHLKMTNFDLLSEESGF